MTTEQENTIAQRARQIALDCVKLLAKPGADCLQWDSENDDGWIARDFVGTVFALSPSGKYYQPWTTNQTEDDEEQDGVFWETFEETLSENGCWHESGECDPCDVFVCRKVDLPDEVSTYTLPAHWASYLINGDASGLEDDDQAECDAFIEKEGINVFDCVGESSFYRRNDAGTLACDCCTYLARVIAKQ